MPNPIPGWRWGLFDARGREDLTHAGSPPSWQRLIIAGEKLSGLAEHISGPHHRLIRVTGRASGRSPGSPTPRGREPAITKFRLHLRDNKEWDDYVEQVPRLLPIVQKTGSKEEKLAASRQVYHPIMAAHGVQWCIVTEVLPVGPHGGGPSYINIEFEETQNPHDISTAQVVAKPKPTNFDYAPIIDIAQSTPIVPSERDLARKPVQAAR